MINFKDHGSTGSPWQYGAILSQDEGCYLKFDILRGGLFLFLHDAYFKPPVVGNRAHFKGNPAHFALNHVPSLQGLLRGINVILALGADGVIRHIHRIYTHSLRIHTQACKRAMSAFENDGDKYLYDKPTCNAIARIPFPRKGIGHGTAVRETGRHESFRLPQGSGDVSVCG